MTLPELQHVDRHQRVDVLGVHVSCIDLDRAVDTFQRWIATSARTYVCVTGMHGVMESQDDDALRCIHNDSGLTTPDGMPMVWAGRRAGARVDRVYGPDLMRAVFERAALEGWSNYFYGGAPEVVDIMIKRLEAQYPGLRVAGRMSPPFRTLEEQEDRMVARAINEARPDIVWVCLGTPRQEHWMASHRDALDAAVLVGVGAAFDLLAGTLPQAPRWMQRIGLEWLFRLAVEPRRLWRRYVLNIPRFMVALMRRPPHLVEGPVNAP